jgi:hypothetical protein
LKKKMYFLFLVILLTPLINACKSAGTGGTLITASLTKKSPVQVPVCLILNDRYMFSTQIEFDDFSRVVLTGSYQAVTTPEACNTNKVWFPQGCPNDQGTYGIGIGNGVPTNFFISIQGVSSAYRKRFAFFGSDDPTIVTGVFPILTLVVKVTNGIVNSLTWDDNCYFSPQRKANGADCFFNAYDLNNFFVSGDNSSLYANFLNPSTGTSIGYDTVITPLQNCLTNQQGGTNPPSPAPATILPVGFCDLGIYIVWVGTSLDGQQLVSGNPRFKRFRNGYSMDSQYPTMVAFNGHSNIGGVPTIPPTRPITNTPISG